MFMLVEKCHHCHPHVSNWFEAIPVLPLLQISGRGTGTPSPPVSVDLSLFLFNFGEGHPL